MKRVIFAILAAVVVAVALSSCASWERGIKDWYSEVGNGLQRTLTVYDYNGQEIRSWSGKMDVVNEENRTLFDMDGKRTIIRGGIIVIQEN